VNVLGASTWSTLLFPLMAKTGSGSIVTLASMAGGRARRPQPRPTLARNPISLAVASSGRGLRNLWHSVECRCSGPVNTGMIRSWSPARRQIFIEKTPLRRIAEPEDIADAVWFLLSDYSRHITAYVSM